MKIDSNADADLITQLGYLCLGSRLKRLGERMQSGVAQMLVEKGVAVQPAQLPLLMALMEEGAMTIGALGTRVGISQPGVSRAMAPLEAEGLVCAAAEGRDRRQRLIMLTGKGQALIADLRESLFPAVQQAVERLCRDAGADFLADLAGIEAGLAREPLDARINRLMQERANG